MFKTTLYRQSTQEEITCTENYLVSNAWKRWIRRTSVLSGHSIYSAEEVLGQEMKNLKHVLATTNTRFNQIFLIQFFTCGRSSPCCTHKQTCFLLLYKGNQVDPNFKKNPQVLQLTNHSHYTETSNQFVPGLGQKMIQYKRKNQEGTPSRFNFLFKMSYNVETGRILIE